MRYRTSTTEINEIGNIEDITIFPNPSSNIVQVNLPNLYQIFSIVIYSPIGQQVLETSDKTIIDISNFANGVYILTLKQGNKNWTTKIVKQ